MEKECMNCGGSIYFQCRKEAAKYNDRLSSREGASEMLNVSVSSLSNYELGLTPVPTDVVVRMADLYGAPELEACYCKNDCPIDLSAKYGSGRVQNRQQRRAEQRKGGKNKHQNRNNFNAVNNG